MYFEIQIYSLGQECTFEMKTEKAWVLALLFLMILIKMFPFFHFFTKKSGEGDGEREGDGKNWQVSSG